MAEDPPRIHYSLKNSSVCLCVTNHPPPYEGNGEWIFAGKLIVSRQQVNPKYKEKVNLNNHNLTLCVHELTEADSGIYKVLFRDSEFNQLTDSHRVVVQGKCYSVLTGSPSCIHTFLNLVVSPILHDNKHKIIAHYLHTMKMFFLTAISKLVNSLDC